MKAINVFQNCKVCEHDLLGNFYLLFIILYACALNAFNDC